MAETSKFFGPLRLHDYSEGVLIPKSDDRQECPCMLCDDVYTLPESEKSMLTHLFTEHRLVIADVNQIADLKGYVVYWRLRFKDENLPHFCTTMLLDQKPDGTISKDEHYYLLSDVLPEDKELRSNLQQAKLESILKHHQFEREDKNYERECLFCRNKVKDTRSTYLKHLYEKHNFHIARPENIIFVDNLIELIAKKLEKLQCIFCEKYFKDRMILKEHMRKKGHKRINPDNKEYDKYFIVNYLEVQKEQWSKRCGQRKSSTNKSQKSGSDYRRVESYENQSNVDSDPDWSDWTEDNMPLITCLLCSHNEAEFENILKHMQKIHDLDFVELTKHLNFYHKIKIVNYVRRQVHLKQCLSCDLKFNDIVNLEKHLKESRHIILDKKQWDQPEFYFPTYEDDLFLCFIQDEDESWWSADDTINNEGQQKLLQESEGDKEDSSSIPKEVALSVLND